MQYLIIYLALVLTEEVWIEEYSIIIMYMTIYLPHRKTVVLNTAPSHLDSPVLMVAWLQSLFWLILESHMTAVLCTTDPSFEERLCDIQEILGQTSDIFLTSFGQRKPLISV